MILLGQLSSILLYVLGKHGGKDQVSLVKIAINYDNGRIFNNNGRWQRGLRALFIDIPQYSAFLVAGIGHCNLYSPLIHW
jgi:pyrrolidone-carboxylate peptidase